MSDLRIRRLVSEENVVLPWGEVQTNIWCIKIVDN